MSFEGDCDMDLGFALTDGAVHVFEEAAKEFSISEFSERAYIRGLPGRIRRGDLGVYTLSLCSRVIGAICYRPIDGDAELVFGSLLPGYEYEEYFLRRVADDLFSSGVHTIRSGLAWPRAAGFTKAASSMGFTMTERIGMARYASGAEPSVGPCRGFELLPWKDEYAEGACLLMSEHSAPSDKDVYPVLATHDGALSLIRSVMMDKHGKFLRELSLVAKADGKTVGFLISTLLLDGSVLVLDIAVDRKYRKKGIGSAMMRWLVSECAIKNKDQVVLAVTEQNRDAIRLYEHLGFKKNMAFRQYVLSLY
jgi:ribosomal protein S18 acetylase RimI-like enzyme